MTAAGNQLEVGTTPRCGGRELAVLAAKEFEMQAPNSNIGHQPTAPSINSRMKSAWPLWRAYSSTMWVYIQRRETASPRADAGVVEAVARSALDGWPRTRLSKWLGQCPNRHRRAGTRSWSSQSWVPQ